MSKAYYNEIDPFAAAWLRELIEEGVIAPGDVDERSVEDVRPIDLLGYTQCHFFAGIGVWSYALRRAGWPDDRPVWTGSCPCQPFSAAGKSGGFTDERHLWPAFEWLVRHGKPPDVVVFGEQVASKPGLAWLDLVQTDMEGQGYAVGAVDMCAAGVGAPHIRQRLFFVADAICERQQERPIQERLERGDGASCAADTQLSERRAHVVGRANDLHEVEERPQGASGLGERGELADAAQQRLYRGGHVRPGGGSEHSDGRVVGHTDDARSQGRGERAGSGAGEFAAREASAAGGMADDNQQGLGKQRSAELLDRERQAYRNDADRCGPTNGFWREADWLICIDGKVRPVESKYVALAHGAPAGLGYLCSQSDHGEAEEKINAEAQIDRDGRPEVRTVQQVELQTARPSQERESGEQQPIELADFVRLLPSSYALAELHGDTATTEALLALLQASGVGGLLQHTPDATETVWRSLSWESQDRFRRHLANGQGRFLRTIEHPLARGAPARTGRLRAYGNAIVAPVAVEFVKAYMIESLL